MADPIDAGLDDEDRAGDLGEPLPGDPAVDQLQRSARQMVQAARGALDAIDELIADRARLGEVVTSFTDLLDRAGRAMSNRPGAAGGPDDLGAVDLIPTNPGDADPGDSSSTQAPRTSRVRRIPVDE